MYNINLIIAIISAYYQLTADTQVRQCTLCNDFIFLYYKVLLTFWIEYPSQRCETEKNNTLHSIMTYCQMCKDDMMERNLHNTMSNRRETEKWRTTERETDKDR